MKWEKSIIEIDSVRRAEKKLLLIYNNLLRYRYKTEHLNLYSGRMGYALFFFYYEMFTQKKNIAKTYLHELNDLMFEKVDNFNYAICFSEFGWLLQHLKRQNMIDIQVDDVLDGLDEYLQDLMINFIEQDNYEVLYGATNIANYFLYRGLDYSPYNFYLNALYEKAVHIDDNKITWMSYVDIATMRKSNDKHVNLGIAHGMPALILFFCKLKEQNFQHPYLDELLVKSCNFILSVENNISQYISHFPSFCLTKAKEMDAFSRLAWCYGDLGVGYALLRASQYYPKIKTKSIEVLLHSAQRRTESSYVTDDCLCHGSIGVAQMYNRIYSVSRLEAFRETAFYWYEKGVNSKYRKNCAAGIGVGGKNGVYGSERSFLSGIAGIGLGLISAISDISPDWDECLLLS